MKYGYSLDVWAVLFYVVPLIIVFVLEASINRFDYVSKFQSDKLPLRKASFLCYVTSRFNYWSVLTETIHASLQPETKWLTVSALNR